MIKLKDGSTITPEKHCWVLSIPQEGTNKVGKYKGRPLLPLEFYPANLKQALKLWLDHSMRKCTTVDEIMANFECIGNQIEDLNVNERALRGY